MTLRMKLLSSIYHIVKISFLSQIGATFRIGGCSCTLVLKSSPIFHRIGLFTLVSPASCSWRGTHRAVRTRAAFSPSSSCSISCILSTVRRSKAELLASPATLNAASRGLDKIINSFNFEPTLKGSIYSL
jgi:hypothetical protein